MKLSNRLTDGAPYGTRTKPDLSRRGLSRGSPARL